MDHDHGMDLGGGMAPPPSTGTSGMNHPMDMMMHMTFFWGTNADILFSGWPGTHSGMYALALIFIFVLAFLVEWLSQSELIKAEGTRDVTAGLCQTLLHTVRVGLAYLVMLAIMSFNGGVFFMVVAGHCLGFLVFGSRLFKRNAQVSRSEKFSNLSPMHC